MRYLPLFLDLQRQAVLVVGGGVVAERKVRLLLDSGARVSVVAPRLGVALARRAARGEIEHLPREFTEPDVAGHRLVIATTNDAAVNRAIAAAAGRRGVFVNVVDDAANSSAIMPAIVDRSPLLVAISSGGTAPMLARRVRAQLEAMLDSSWTRLAVLLQRWRGRIRAAIHDLAARRQFYDRLLDGPVARLVRDRREGEAEQSLAGQLAAATAGPASAAPVQGSVTLVGAGPGDPGLLTLHALRALNQADVVLHDRLVPDEVLAMARRDADLVDVGKVAGNPLVSQAAINRLMVTHARAGRRVVRLKGGDPFMFGRGGEELEHLREAGIDYECVPGVTAALACAAHAGIPLTHRDHARGVRFVTAHRRGDLGPGDWDLLAAGDDTLAIYMGVATLPELCEQLLRRGRGPTTPVAIIENGSRHDQRVLIAELGTIAQWAADHAVRSPALVIVGSVAALGRTLHWSGTAPIVAPPCAPVAPQSALPPQALAS